MDILTHAVVGAVTGGAMGHPLLGAIAAVLPDIPLWVQRRPTHPPAAYLALHSGVAVVLLVVACLVWAHTGFISATFGATVAACWISHIILDLATHGNQWQPRILWPNKDFILLPDFIEEWEFFNGTWWMGIFISFLWILGVLWLHVMYHGHVFGIGYQS